MAKKTARSASRASVAKKKSGRTASQPARRARKTVKAAPKKTSAGKAKRTGGKTAGQKARPAKQTAVRATKREIRTPKARKAAKRSMASKAVKKAGRKAPAKAPTRKSRGAGKPATRKVRKPVAKRTGAGAARPKAGAQEKRSAGVEKLLALQAEKTAARPRKQEFLIKAPKKTKQAASSAALRFSRRIAVPTPVQEPPPKEARKHKAGLRKKMLDELHQALDTERQRLITQLAALDEAASLRAPSDVNEDVPGYSIHLAEYASDSQVVETTLAQRVLQAERLKEIEEALMRIGQPGYGICQMCDNPIGIERLRIKPSAAFCVHCREKKEKGLA